MRIGIDLGGTKIEIALLAETGEILFQQRAPTPQGDYPRTLAVVAGLVASAEQAAGLASRLPLGVGIPGAISPATGRIQNANSVCLIGQDLAGDLSALLQRPVRLANDADCFALSEATDGAGAGAPTVFGVILGTGVGGGVVVGQQPLSGPNAIAGEWGHNPLPWPKPDELPGPPCYCGKRGCIETFLSGPGLALDYELLTGAHRSPLEIARLAAAGDHRAESILARYEDRLARALALVINILDPHVVVLGGGISNLERLYHAIPTLWSAHIFCSQPATRLVRARFGDSSGVRGAAWLWPARSILAMGSACH
ncbi:MAG: ROK family protein [Magnetococcales bacterium]|nr:ROK family protein [Magnetococcales bacterium]